jgi:uncharacterized protein (DUF302 family)
MRITNIFIALITVFIIGFSSAVLANGGLISKKSKFSAVETIDRLEKILKKKGLTVMGRVTHSDNAAGVDIKVRPTVLLIFGNPKLGSHFMTSNQLSAIDLPMKALAWEDEKGQVWLTYNDPKYIANRHFIKDREKIVNKMSGALSKLTSKAAGE